MSEKMLKNYDATMHGKKSLVESVDAIRASVKDLYELDDDNYQMIKNLQKNLDLANEKVAAGAKALNRLRKRTALGFLCIGGIFWLWNKAGKRVEESLDDLESRVRAMEVGEKHEESDG